MSYIPPHKRISADAKISTPSSPAADSLTDRFSKSLRLGRNRRLPSLPVGMAIYASGSTFLWWPVGSGDDDEPIPDSFCLERVPGAKHLVLCRNPLSGGSGSGGLDETPWETIAERIEPHLFACVQRAMEAKATAAEGKNVKPLFVARVGKVHFKDEMHLPSMRRLLQQQLRFHCSLAPPPANPKLFVAGLSWSAGEKSLNDAFSSFGEVTGDYCGGIAI